MTTITPIDVGTAANDGTGDPIRTAFQKINTNEAALNTGKAEAVHEHEIADVTGLQTALDGKADDEHEHVIADVTGLQTALDGKADDEHEHEIADVTGLQTALDAKAAASHEHEIADVTGLQTALDAKAAASHEHTLADITDAGTAAAQDVEDFAAASHQHVMADVTDLPVLASGRYTPTLTEIGGFSSLTPNLSHYTRIGNQVTVYFDVSASINDGDDYVSFRISLPIASNFTSAFDATGSFSYDGPNNFGPGFVYADPTNDAAVAEVFAAASTDNGATFIGSFQYEVK